MARTAFERGYREGHTIGDTARQLYKFINEGNCNPDFPVVSPAEAYDDMPARDLFGTWGRKNCNPSGYLVKPEKLSWTPEIRAIASKGRRVVVETSKLDLDRLSRITGFEKLGIVLRGRQIFYQAEQIIQTYTKNAAKPPIIDVRTISTFLPRYGSYSLDKALDVIDYIFNYNCFAEPVERNAPSAMAPAIKLLQKQELSQEQKQELRQTLNQIQVPILIMSTQMTPCLVARTAYKAGILKMSQEELDRHIKKALG